MEVILLERIEKLGQMGDVVKVKSGYARNYLLPQKKALRATDANKRHFEEQRAQLEAANLEHRAEAEKMAKKMESLSVVMVRQAGEAGQLYGSVNARDISTAVTEAGFTIARQQVELNHPIKALGLHPVRVSLHPEIDIEVIANIARSQDEAKVQSKTGKAVVRTEEEEAPAPETAPEPEPGKTKENKAKADAEREQAAKAAEEAANEAVAEQAGEIFEEGAAPEIEPEPEKTAADADGEAPETTESPDEDGKAEKKSK
ncbi:MAG: 50S ribosomal protein L9 [Rhodospirillaceae bacterium]|jgi:large subunit ribosomal protein L9|nr:50S ribosomal protein L9 [Rhodospirillaceae bacterium]|tara:strand:- start:2290 stop:3066 length:777 start_codon:yes stop_codon:yes gene_type:complete